jgi:hypothetical protein
MNNITIRAAAQRPKLFIVIALSIPTYPPSVLSVGTLQVYFTAKQKYFTHSGEISPPPSCLHSRVIQGIYHTQPHLQTAAMSGGLSLSPLGIWCLVVCPLAPGILYPLGCGV